eukprot:12936035-Prorocentrum_lima.AAC.1
MALGSMTEPRCEPGDEPTWAWPPDLDQGSGGSLQWGIPGGGSPEARTPSLETARHLEEVIMEELRICLLYTSPSPRDSTSS